MREAEHHDTERHHQEPHQFGLRSGVADAFLQIFERAGVADESGGALGQGDRQAHRDQRKHGRYPVHACDTDDRNADHHTGGCGSDHAGDLSAHRAEHDCVREAVPADDLRRQCHPGRCEDRDRGASDDRGRDDHPVGDHVGLDRNRNQHRRDGVDQLGGDEDGALREAVGENTTGRDRDQPGNTEADQHTAECRVGAGEFVGQPAPGDLLGLHCEEDEDAAPPKTAELGDRQGGEASRGFRRIRHQRRP